MTATTPTRAVQTAARLDPRSDADLLGHFHSHRDQSAFAALVHRHGPLVYGVCRRALGATADADDAFQATFLVLVKRAGAIPWRANLGPWLFGVAHRVAAKARFRRDRRFALEKQVDAMPHPESSPADRTESDDLSRLFDEELAKLPEEMRRAVVLCELQGMSRQAAAKHLRVSEGTLSSRLGRARKKLAAAFAGRGVKLVIPAGVGVGVTLAGSTVRAACDPAGAVPAGVSFLVQEALKAMTLSKLKIGAVLAAVAVGCSWAAFADEPKKPIAPPAAKADGKPVPPPAKADKPAANAVATVNGQDISREEFAEHLIRKYGAKEIELFVNQRIIQDAAAEKDVRLPADVVVAAFEADAKAAGVSRDEFVKVVLPKYGKTEHEWWTEVLTPRLMLEKLLRDEVTVTDDDLKKLFERKYGEQRKVQMILWEEKVTKEEYVREAYKTVKSDSDQFEQKAARLAGLTLQAWKGHIQSMGRAFGSNSDQALNDAVFALKVGEVSELITTEQGWVAVRLVEILPPRTDKKFDDEKAKLREEVAQMKMQVAIPKLFARLKEEAKPVYHIKPEPKTDTVPLPVKK